MLTMLKYTSVFGLRKKKKKSQIPELRRVTFLKKSKILIY